MGLTADELKSLIEKRLETVGAPTFCSIIVEEDRDDLGNTFPMTLKSELWIHLEAHEGSPKGEIRCSERVLEWPMFPLANAVEESIRDALCSLCPNWGEEGVNAPTQALPSTWRACELKDYLSSVSADPPCVRYPSGSIIEVCHCCGKTSVRDVCSIAFSHDADWGVVCPDCGRLRSVGLSRCEAFLLPGDRMVMLEGEILDALALEGPYHSATIDLSKMIERGQLPSARELSLEVWRAKGGMVFDEAFTFLVNHPIYCGRFFQCADFDSVEVCSRTTQAEDPSSCFASDTCMVWVESGPYEISDDYVGPTDDLDLHCGGWTFEEAVVHLAHLVKQYYGTDRERP